MDVIHRFNEVGLARLDPRWAGGRPRLLGPDDEVLVVRTATTRPAEPGQPFTRWSIRKLTAHLRKVHGRVIRIGREALRSLLAGRGVTFQRTKTWKESTDPERDAELDRIEHVLERFPDRTFAFDEFGPLGIRPTAGSAWAERGRPERLPATDRRTATMDAAELEAGQRERTAGMIRLAELLAAGTPASADSVQAEIDARYRWLAELHPVTPEEFRAMGLGCVQNPSWRAAYEAVTPGLAEYQHTAIEFYATTRLV
nr:TipAS antibiotic-recognition domain-containing protein [Streptomyces sp. XY431]